MRWHFGIDNDTPAQSQLFVMRAVAGEPCDGEASDTVPTVVWYIPFSWGCWGQIQHFKSKQKNFYRCFVGLRFYYFNNSQTHKYITYRRNKIVDNKIKRGDIYYVNLFDANGREEAGVRPCLILQNNKGNKHSPTTIIAPISSRMEHASLPIHAVVSCQTSGLTTASMVFLEQIRVIDKSRLLTKIGYIPLYMMDNIDKALKISVGLNKKYN